MIDVACVGILVADIIANPIDAIPEKGNRYTYRSLLQVFTAEETP